MQHPQAGKEEEERKAQEAPGLVFSRGGLTGLWGPRVTLERAGRLSFGGESLDLGELRFVEYRQGFLTLGGGGHWWTLDLARYRDPAGPLVLDGALSPSAVRFLWGLQEAARRNAGTPEGVSQELPPLLLRGRIHVDRLEIIVSLATVLLLLGELHLGGWEGVLSGPGLFRLTLLLVLGTAVLWLLRRTSGLRIDGRGLTSFNLFRSSFHPWRELSEYRRQQTEVEVHGQEGPVALHLDVLRAGGTPLILRRGRHGFLSLPGRILLEHLGRWLREGVEEPLPLAPGLRRVSRLWIGLLVGLNSAMYFGVQGLPPDEFQRRLIALGARIGEWSEEPWRLVASLFLHGSLSHLLINMLVLALVGPWAARVFGWARTLAIYLAGGALGNLIGGTLLGRPGGTEIPSVGASTAILALLGALFTACHAWPARIPLAARARLRWGIPITVVLTLALGDAIPVLDNGAHLGGFLAGLCLARLLPPPARPAKPDRGAPPDRAT